MPPLEGQTFARSAHPGRTVDDGDGQVSWLAGQCRRAAFSGTGVPNGIMARMLAAYSCRGSAGVEPASLFTPLPGNLSREES